MGGDFGEIEFLNFTFDGVGSQALHGSEGSLEGHYHGAMAVLHTELKHLINSLPITVCSVIAVL